MGYLHFAAITHISSDGDISATYTRKLALSANTNSCGLSLLQVFEGFVELFLNSRICRFVHT